MEIEQTRRLAWRPVEIACAPAYRRIVGKRREIAMALVALALADGLWGGARAVDLLEPSWSLAWCGTWLLLLGGAALRLWGAGNLHKNEEITRTGIYRMVRHPLYLGSIATYLAIFWACGSPALAAPLSAVLLGLVYYPKMLQEEECLAREFPAQYAEYEATPRLFPRLVAFGDAVRTDRFSLRRAYDNYVLWSLASLVLVPVLTALLVHARP